MPISADLARALEENAALRHQTDALLTENYKLKRALIDLDIRRIRMPRVVEAQATEVER